MKEKYEELKKEIMDFKNTQRECKHEWDNPVYEPNLFDGAERWILTCKLCGQKIISFNNIELPDKSIKK